MKPILSNKEAAPRRSRRRRKRRKGIQNSSNFQNYNEQNYSSRFNHRRTQKTRGFRQGRALFRIPIDTSANISVGESTVVTNIPPGVGSSFGGSNQNFQLPMYYEDEKSPQQQQLTPHINTGYNQMGYSAPIKTEQYNMNDERFAQADTFHGQASSLGQQFESSHQPSVNLGSLSHSGPLNLTQTSLPGSQSIPTFNPSLSRMGESTVVTNIPPGVGSSFGGSNQNFQLPMYYEDEKSPQQQQLTPHINTGYNQMGYSAPIKTEQYNMNDERFAQADTFHGQASSLGQQFESSQSSVNLGSLPHSGPLNPTRTLLPGSQSIPTFNLSLSRMGESTVVTNIPPGVGPSFGGSIQDFQQPKYYEDKKSLNQQQLTAHINTGYNQMGYSAPIKTEQYNMNDERFAQADTFHGQASSLGQQFESSQSSVNLGSLPHSGPLNLTRTLLPGSQSIPTFNLSLSRMGESNVVTRIPSGVPPIGGTRYITGQDGIQNIQEPMYYENTRTMQQHLTPHINTGYNQMGYSAPIKTEQHNINDERFAQADNTFHGQASSLGQQNMGYNQMGYSAPIKTEQNNMNDGRFAQADNIFHGQASSLGQQFQSSQQPGVNLGSLSHSGPLNPTRTLLPGSQSIPTFNPRLSRMGESTVVTRIPSGVPPIGGTRYITGQDGIQIFQQPMYYENTRTMQQQLTPHINMGYNQMGYSAPIKTEQYNMNDGRFAQADNTFHGQSSSLGQQFQSSQQPSVNFGSLSHSGPLNPTRTLLPGSQSIPNFNPRLSRMGESTVDTNIPSSLPPIGGTRYIMGQDGTQNFWQPMYYENTRTMQQQLTPHINMGYNQMGYSAPMREQYNMNDGRFAQADNTFHVQVSSLIQQDRTNTMSGSSQEAVQQPRIRMTKPDFSSLPAY